MKSGQEQFLRGCLGDDGVEALKKTIQREGYLIPTEMQEQYLAMLVVPHSLLAWVISTTKQLKEKENREFDVPGQVGTKLLLNKTKSDIYTGYLHKEGQVLHRFTGLSIPQLAGHLMTVLELYDGIKPEVAADKKVVDGVAPLIDKLVQDRFAPQMPAINITINTGVPAAPKVEAPGFVTEPPVLKGPAPVEETSEESKKPKAKKDEDDEIEKGLGDKERSQFIDRFKQKLVDRKQKKQDTQKLIDEQNAKIRESINKHPEPKDSTVKAEESTTISTSENSQHTNKSEADLDALATQIVQKAIQECTVPEESAAPKPKAFGLVLSKQEMDTRCPDCGGSEFENEKFVGCVCMSSMQECKVKVVKNEDETYKLQFGRKWTSDDVKMFLDIIKRNRHE